MFELFRKYTKSDSALDQNKKHKDNLEHLVEDMNATQTSNEDEFEKIRQETSQLIIDVAKEQSEIDAKQNAEIAKKATSQALVEEEKARDLADKAQVQEIGDLQEKTTALEHKMSSLEKKGSFKGTYATLAQAQAKLPNPLDGDYILVGTQSPYQEYIFENNIWEQGGLATASAIDTTLLAQKDLSNIADATFLAKAIQALVASQHYVDERTISFATMENGKTYLTKQNQDGTRTYWAFDPAQLLVDSKAYADGKFIPLTRIKTITIPEQTIYRTHKTFFTEYTNNKDYDVSLADWTIDSVVVCEWATDQKPDTTPTQYTSELECYWLYGGTQRVHLVVNKDTNKVRPTDLNGIWGGGTRWSITIQYKKTIPAQTFKVLTDA